MKEVLRPRKGFLLFDLRQKGLIFADLKHYVIEQMDRELFKKLASTATNVAQIRSSAMQPLLWIVGVGSLLFFLAAYFIPAFQGILIAIPIGLVGFFILFYVYFAFKDPDRLQSEQYQLKRFEIQVQAIQGVKGPEVIEDKTLAHNPELVEKEEIKS